MFTLKGYDSEFQFNYAIEDNSKVVIDYVDSELGDEVLITGSVLKAQEGGKDVIWSHRRTRKDNAQRNILLLWRQLVLPLIRK